MPHEIQKKSLCLLARSFYKCFEQNVFFVIDNIIVKMKPRLLQVDTAEPHHSSWSHSLYLGQMKRNTVRCKVHDGKTKPRHNNTLTNCKQKGTKCT